MGRLCRCSRSVMFVFIPKELFLPPITCFFHSGRSWLVSPIPRILAAKALPSSEKNHVLNTCTTWKATGKIILVNRLINSIDGTCYCDLQTYSRTPCIRTLGGLTPRWNQFLRITHHLFQLTLWVCLNMKIDSTTLVFLTQDVSCNLTDFNEYALIFKLPKCFLRHFSLL